MEVNKIYKLIEKQFLITGKRQLYIEVEHKDGREGVYAITKDIRIDDNEQIGVVYSVDSVAVEEGVIETDKIGTVESVLEDRINKFDIISDIEAMRCLEGDIEAEKYKRRVILMNEIRNSSLEYFSEDELIDILVAMKEEPYLPNVEFPEDNKNAWKEFVNILAKPY